MSTAPPIRRAIAISPKRTNPQLKRLVDFLGQAGVAIEVVTTVDDATATLVMAGGENAECVLIDASEVAASGVPRLFEAVAAEVRRLRVQVPGIAPVVIAPHPPAALVTAAFRAGAGDVIDVAIESEASVLHALDRSAEEYRERLERRGRISDLRVMIEEFLRVLVRAERRSIDLENQLRAAAGEGSLEEDDADLDPDRPPVVLVVDDDEATLDLLVDVLGRAGMHVFSSSSGEDAVEVVAEMSASRQAVDLVLMDGKLPGIDGLEAIRRMRAARPGLVVMLMTGYSTTESAIGAADLGVVGYILKPFDNVEGLAERVRETADKTVAERRERRYLLRIKERHAEFLLRYRKLASDLDRLD